MSTKKEVCVCKYPEPQVHIHPGNTIAYYCKRCLRIFVRKSKK